MTDPDVDAALDRSNPLWHPTIIQANWKELPPGYDDGISNVDDVRQLGEQLGPGGYTVDHSYDDGLPDAVTMTSQNDASGQLEADLVGRQGSTADVIGWRAQMLGGSGTGTQITVSHTGTSAYFHDYTLVGVALNADIGYKTNVDPEDLHGWQLLATQVDGQIKLMVFGRQHYVGAPSLMLTLDSATQWAWVGASAAAQTYSPAQALVPLRPGTPVGVSESVSQANHTLTMDLDRRGYAVGFWATNGALSWDPVGDSVQVDESFSTVRIAMTRSPLRQVPGRETLVASTSAATATAAFIGIPLEVIDRGRMGAGEFFSPFNDDSPIAGFDRDTADVTVTQPVVSPAGIKNLDLFKGQMADIPMQGSNATLSAFSRTRVDLDRAVLLPPIRGDREALTTDWVTSYLMAQGGQYIGVPPSRYTRWWAPMHGGLHPFMDGPLSYPAAFWYDKDSTPHGPFGLKPPTIVNSPFVTGVYGQHRDKRSEEVVILSDRRWATEVPGIDDPYMYDVLSQQNAVGRFTVWVRGDTHDTPAASVDDASQADAANYLWRFNLYNDVGTTGVATAGPQVRIGCWFDSRDLVVWIGNQGWSLNHPLPADGQWHFIGLVYNHHNGSAHIRMDDWTTDFAPGGFDVTPPLRALPVSDQAHYDAGKYRWMNLRSKLPIAEAQLECGPNLMDVSERFTRFWPTVTGRNLNYRRTHIDLGAVTTPAPVQGWSTLAELARSSLSHYRTNEVDQYEFLPPEWFGEAAQMTPALIADTEVNASELDVKLDPSKSRNVVTVEFPETRVESKLSTILGISTAIRIPRGITDLTFALDEPVAEIHGASQPYSGYGTNPGGMWTITRLTSGQIATPSTIPANVHYIAFAARDDGTLPLSAGLSAWVTAWTSSTVSIRVVNSGYLAGYIAHNNSDIPFMRILGYKVTTNLGYVTARDPGSIGFRRERALSVHLPWVHTRGDATVIAGQLVTMLARPRAEVTVNVMGDPRRKPGQLVTLKDAERTRAAGTWRILSISHNGNGAKFTQRLQLVRIPPLALWDDQGVWDDSVWGE